MSFPRCQHPHSVKNGHINANSALNAKIAPINGQKITDTQADRSQKKPSPSFSSATDFP